MRLYQISDIDYTQKLKIQTIRGQLADGAWWTVVRSNQWDVHSATGLHIQVNELLFDNAYLSNVVEDQKPWFTRMELRDLICH